MRRRFPLVTLIVALLLLTASLADAGLFRRHRQQKPEIVQVPEFIPPASPSSDAEIRANELPRLTFTAYKDAKGEWRWYLKSPNGNTLADSGEGYKNQKDALDAIESIQDRARWAVVEWPQLQKPENDKTPLEIFNEREKKNK